MPLKKYQIKMNREFQMHPVQYGKKWMEILPLSSFLEPIATGLELGWLCSSWNMAGIFSVKLTLGSSIAKVKGGLHSSAVEQRGFFPSKIQSYT